MPAENEISVRTWANRHGISIQAAYKRLKAYGIAKNADGLINAAEADRLVSEKLDARQQRRQHQQFEEPAAEETLNAVRLRLEKAKAGKAEAEYDQLKGTLVPTEEVQRIWSELVSPAKTRLLAIGAKLAPELAITADAARCKELVDEAVAEALSEISGYRPYA